MQHRLLCCSDTHGDAPPAIDDDAMATAWLHAGDLYEGPTIIGSAQDDLPSLAGDPIAGVFLDWTRRRRARVRGSWEP